MDWLDQAHEYLVNRMSEGRNRWSSGMKLLGGNTTTFEDVDGYTHTIRSGGWVDHSKYFRSTLNTVDAILSQNIDVYDADMGVCKTTLTSVCMSLGKEFLSHTRRKKRFTNSEYVQVGALFIEALAHAGRVSVETPEQYSSTPAYVVFEWKEPPNVLRGLYSEKPEALGFKQTVQYKGYEPHEVYTIKRWTSTQDEDEFKLMEGCESLRAATKLAQTEWRVNLDVLIAVIKQPHKFFSTTCTTVENASKRIEYEYIISTARKVAADTFYFATEFDYRGRIYFTCPFFNFQGSDLAKSLLCFSEERLVTASGLRWMKIHCAASYNQGYKKHTIPDWCTSDYATYLEGEELTDISVDKMTLRDRELWVDNNWELIERTANEKILHDCEKPVAFLAVCIELVNYYNSPEHPGIGRWYQSDLPIPVDGSNNGWQHLGAISKDSRTGKLVGLSPVEIQQDFYVQTAKTLHLSTKKERSKEILDQMPMKHIRKGISKRGSMTRAYSAGAIKIGENMYQDCKKEGFTTLYDITPDDCTELARGLIKAIDIVCPGPLQTMKYLQKVAAEEIENGVTQLEWVSPSGFRVTYTAPYEYKPTVSLRMKLPDGLKKIGLKILETKPGTADKRRFMCGISPNFIHSQDAAHMAKTICSFDGAFGAVHDSFSTHASQVDTLLEVTKDEFVKMYDVDDYFTDITNRLSPFTKVDRPVLGDLNIGDIYDSEYFFA